jgi:hypothetical protein
MIFYVTSYKLYAQEINKINIVPVLIVYASDETDVINTK